MALTQFTKDMNIIAALSDDPNVTDGLTAAQLKAKFDEGGLAVKTYLNGTLKDFVDGLDGNKQTQITVLTGTAGSSASSAWTKHSISISGTTRYYHAITINVPESALSDTAKGRLFAASTIIVRPHVNKVFPFTIDNSGLANLANCSGVEFAVAGVENSGGRYIMTIVAYGWGNTTGKQVDLDIIAIDDTLDSAVGFVTEGMTPVSN